MENRKLAWIIVVPLMIVSVFLGGFTTYLQASRRIEAAYRSEVEPVLHEKVQILYNMVTLHRLNNSDEAVLRGVLQNIAETQRQIENFGQTDIQKLQADADILFAASDELDEADAFRMLLLHFDINERAEILRQTNYNRIAKEFNSGILSNFGKLPTF